MSRSFPSLVSTQWLSEHIGAPGLAVLDASLHLPAAQRDPKAEYADGHIPGARFLDLASWTDPTSDVPAALPNAAQVAQRLEQLGIASEDRIVLYDDSAVKTSARAWFILTAHGIKNVAILDGGLAAWRAEGRALESGDTPMTPTAHRPPHSAKRVVSKAQVLMAVEDKSAQILDARSGDRVFGSGIDPVHGGQNGRIPGSMNLPFGEVFDQQGKYKPVAQLRASFEEAGVDLDRQLITTCGSGVTASVLLFAAHLAGKDDVQLYDGSWQEWEADPDTPKQQGPKG